MVFFRGFNSNPPNIALSTPVVFGNVIGNLFKYLADKYAINSASMKSDTNSNSKSECTIFNCYFSLSIKNLFFVPPPQKIIFLTFLGKIFIPH